MSETIGRRSLMSDGQDDHPTPASLAGPDPDALIVRWQQLGEDQREQVIEFLAERRTDVLADALDFEERTRPDDD